MDLYEHIVDRAVIENKKSKANYGATRPAAGAFVLIWWIGATPLFSNTIGHPRFPNAQPGQGKGCTRLKNTQVMPDAHRAKAHVKIGEADPEQTHPCPEHVAAVETTDAAIGLVAGRRP